MCGIVGFVGAKEASPILLDGLSRLEYRGYDSAGIAVFDDEEKKLNVYKAKGRLKVLKELTKDGSILKGSVGIGHTRWATHGEPNDINSHPHINGNGKIAVVHNGIIENHVELRKFLIENGVKFVSETDTEVVAHLIGYFYEKDDITVLKAVSRALRHIKGAYALGILCSDIPDQIIAVRKDSPLLLGFGEGCNLIASDATAIIKHTRNVGYMDDGEIAVLSNDKIECYNELLQPIEKEISYIDWDVSSTEKGGHKHFMIKEILEQPLALRQTILPRIKDKKVVFEDFNLSQEYLKEVNKIYIIACGSANNVGVIAKYHLERYAKIPTEIALASEFRYMSPILDEKTLVIAISQSGETLDTVAALREAKRLGAKVLSIVNVVGSTIARESDQVIYTWAGPEIAVATTKAYSAQLAVLNLFTIFMADVKKTLPCEECEKMLEEILLIPEKVEKILDQIDNIKYFASKYFNHESVFFIGRNTDYALGLEGSLKLKEISYIHSEAYASGELKHGTISLIEKGTLVVALSIYDKLFHKSHSNVVEVKTRGADILSVVTENNIENIKDVSNDIMVIPNADDICLPSLGVIPLQIFSYYVALMRGCDIDKPRNLAKSVTVE